jgi:uncharacterized protein YbjQ (UPF0145 family)
MQPIINGGAIIIISIVLPFVVSLIALQGGHLNGNVEDARKDVDSAIERMEETQRKAVVHLTKETK